MNRNLRIRDPRAAGRAARGLALLTALGVGLATGPVGTAPASAQDVAVSTTSSRTPAAAPGANLAAAPRATDVAPGAVWDPIPFGAARKSQTANYARIHYGINSAQLTDVRQLVLHYTVSSTYASARSVFASNRKARTPSGTYVSPGTCTHFVVDRDGTVYQLVPLNLMCRHAVGLNHRSIGIEFVEMRSADAILKRPKQLAAGLALVRWLQARYGIANSDVIGHAMVNNSRFFQERVKGWRNTHVDWNARQVAKFRKAL